MRTEVFREEHDVELTEDERQLRGRQAARLAVAIRAQKRRAEEEADAWKERKAKLKSDEEDLVKTLYSTSDAAETGREKRQVECREELVGAMVVTVRCDTDETVSTRPATKEELKSAPDPIVPGGGQKKKGKGKAPHQDDPVVEDDYAPKH